RPAQQRDVERAVLLADARRAGADRAWRRDGDRRVTDPVARRLAAARLQRAADRRDVVVGAGGIRAGAAADRQPDRGVLRRPRVRIRALPRLAAAPPAPAR